MITSWLYQNDKKLKNKDLEKIIAEAREKEVEFLDLSKNQFSHFSYIGEPLPSLKVLDMSYNKATLEEFILSAEAFPHLECLFLHHSQIKKFEMRGSFPHLRTIDVSNNQLTTFNLLLEDVSNFPCMESLYLYENPITNLPKEVFDKDRENVWEGVRNVLKYSPTQKSYLQEGKMILIGNGEVGKTSIRFKLLDREAILPKKADRTQGVDLSPTKYNVKNIDDNELYVDEYKVKNIDFSLYIWDFGGQGKYREVQQLFCSRKSLYLFVTAYDDQETNEDYVGFEYWLSMANAFGYDKESQKHSPIIHVLNKIDEQDNGTNETNLKRDFPNIYKFVKISCKTLSQFDSLENAIAETLPNISKDIFTTEFPNPWLAVKKDLEDIEKEGETHILYTKYLTICAKKEINENEAKTLIETLDLMGYLVYYGQNPKLRDWIILNPRWVKDAIYKVLDSAIIIDNYGKFTPANFPHIWVEYEVSKPFLQRVKDIFKPISRKYTSPERDKLVNLMLAYEFCYEQLDRHGKPFYMIPSLFGEKPPIDTSLQQFDYQIRFVYAPFIPAGTVNKLIVRLHKQIYNEYKWKNGVILHDSATNSYAEITEIWKEKSVHLCLKGQDIEILYASIFQTLQELNQDLKNTKFLARLDFKVEVHYKNKWRSLEDIKDFEITDFLFLFGKLHGDTFKENNIMNIGNPTIQKALKHLQNANYSGYFEEMDKVVPINIQTPYQEHKGKFIAGQAPWNFHQILETFAREVDKALVVTNVKTITKIPDNKLEHKSMNNIPQSFIEEVRKQIEDEYQMIADANLRRSVTRNESKRQEYESLISQSEENISFAENRFLSKVQRQDPNFKEADIKAFIDEMKNEIQASLHKQELKLNSILERIDESKREIISEVVSQISAENAEVIQSMYNSMSEITASEANKLIEKVTASLPATLPNQQEIKQQLNSIDVTMSSKLKLAIPIIPMLLSYEVDLGNQWADHIPKAWKNFIGLFVKK